MCLVLIAWLTASVLAGAEAGAAYQVEQTGAAATVKTPDGKPIVRYVLGKLPADEPQTSVPCVGYLHPISTPAGEVLTESRPGDHSWLRGAFWAWPQVGGSRPAGFWTCGQAVWKEKGAIVNRKAAVRAGVAAGQLTAANAWTDGEADVLLETTTVRAAADAGMHVIDLTTKLEAAGEEAKLQSWAFAGFGFHGRRVVGETVSFLSPEGEVQRPISTWNDPKTNWPDARWYAVALKSRDDKRCGLAIVNHKDNPKTTWHVHAGLRFLNPNVTADEPYVLRRGESLVLRYRLVAFDGPPPTNELDRLAEQFCEPPAAQPNAVSEATEGK